MKISTKKPAKKKSDYSPREAQARFERAVDAAIATKPIHKVTNKRNARGRGQ
jgi:hypothetical protein